MSDGCTDANRGNRWPTYKYKTICVFCKKEIPDDHTRIYNPKTKEYICMRCEGRLTKHGQE